MISSRKSIAKLVSIRGHKTSFKLYNCQLNLK